MTLTACAPSLLEENAEADHQALLVLETEQAPVKHLFLDLQLQGEAEQLRLSTPYMSYELRVPT